MINLFCEIFEMGKLWVIIVCVITFLQATNITFKKIRAKLCRGIRNSQYSIL
jgi:hypothetical protein